MKKINNSRGFSIIELMVTAGISSVAILGIMHFMKMRLSEAKYMESLSEIDRKVNNMRFYLLDKEACFNTLGGVKLPSDTSTALPILTIKNRKNLVVQEIPDPINNADIVKLNKLELLNTASIGPDSYGVVEIVGTFDRDVKRSMGIEKVVRKLEVTVGTGPDLEITQCFSNTENAIESAYNKVCEDMGGKLEIASKKCVFFSLLKGQHTEEQCKSLGGVIFETATGNICRIQEGTEIPNGWTQYQEWSTTESSTSTDVDCETKNTVVTAENFAVISSNPDMYAEFPAVIQTACTASSHAWDSVAHESCSFVCVEKSPCAYGTCRQVTRVHKSIVKERGYY